MIARHDLRPMRMAWITNALAPYRIPLWSAVAERCSLAVMLLAEGDAFRSWSPDYGGVRCELRCVPGHGQIGIRHLDWASALSFGSVGRMLDTIRPDLVLLGGYEQPGYWAALHWARRRSIPAVLWMESTLLSTRTAHSRIITGLKRAFVRRCASFYAAGMHSAEYLEFLGAPGEKIVTGTNVADAAAFPSPEKVTGGPPALLFAGQLIARKNLRGVLEALAGLRHLPWTLEVAGTGPLERELRAFAECRLRGRVYWLGFVPPERMTMVYRHADVVLLPSLNEVWGLTVNEALLSGAFVIGSERAAAALELLEPGSNGLLVEPEDIGGLREAIVRALLAMPFDRAAIRKSVAHLTPEREAAKVELAACLALHRATEPVYAAG